jgi:hypothetical protein
MLSGTATGSLNLLSSASVRSLTVASVHPKRSDMSAAMARGKCCAGAWGLWGASVGLREVFWCRRGESAVRVERYTYLYSTYRYTSQTLDSHNRMEKFQSTKTKHRMIEADALMRNFSFLNSQFFSFLEHTCHLHQLAGTLINSPVTKY